MESVTIFKTDQDSLQRERPPTSTLLTNWCWDRRMLHKLTVQYDRLREKRVFILLTKHQFVNSINVGGRLRCCWSPYQIFLLSIQFVSNA